MNTIAVNKSFDVATVRKDFPILNVEVHGNPLVYFDNAATTQKPQQVIDTLNDYYRRYNSNVHRGVHYLSQVATDAYEEARLKVSKLLNASSSAEIIFTRGTTESINLIAFSFGEVFIHEGDEIIISTIEHHSNIVPWQLLCQRKKAVLKVIPVLDNGVLDLEAYRGLFSEHTKLVAVGHISNALGTVNPIAEMIATAHAHQVPVLIDGAQGLPHGKVDVQSLDCDFYCFSGHKMYGPTGIGGFYGRMSLLEQMPPYQSGGEMIQDVSFACTTFNEVPYKFEAGTPNIADAIGLATAIEYLEKVGWDAIAKYEQELLRYATEKLTLEGGITIIGTAPDKASLISFLIDGVHPLDAGTIIDHFGIAIRTGNHCAQPLMDRFGITGTIRASFAFYNTFEEIDRLMAAIRKVKQMFL
ncbi:MAG: cysteine desulfurase [Bacteroidota bacterium]|nr:cysteine desulfurase [Bacteroidota bacterium]